MFFKSVTKTGRDPPSECKKITFFAKAFLAFFVFDAVSKKFKFSPAIPPMKFECIFWPEMRESWDLETAGVGAGHSPQFLTVASPAAVATGQPPADH